MWTQIKLQHLENCIRIEIKQELGEGKERGVTIWGLRSHFKGKLCQERKSEATTLNSFSVPALSVCLLEHPRVLQQLKLLKRSSVKNNIKIISL